jgi:hypothetical protein
VPAVERAAEAGALIGREARAGLAHGLAPILVAAADIGAAALLTVAIPRLDALSLALGRLLVPIPPALDLAAFALPPLVYARVVTTGCALAGRVAAFLGAISAVVAFN